MPARRLAVLLLGLLVLAGCAREPASRWVPPLEDTVARQFIEQLRQGRVDTAYLSLEPSVRNADGMRGLEEIVAAFHGGKPKGVEVIGGSVQPDPRLGGRRVLLLSYQVELTTGWFAGNIGLVGQGGVIRVAGARFRPLSAPLQRLNAFTLRGKDWRHWVALELAVVMPLLSLWACVACLRSRVRYRWLWALFIVVGVGAVTFDWTDASLAFSPAVVQFLGAGASRQGLYGPWTITLAFPLGAILFLALRKRLPLRAAAPQRNAAKAKKR